MNRKQPGEQVSTQTLSLLVGPSGGGLFFLHVGLALNDYILGWLFRQSRVGFSPWQVTQRTGVPSKGQQLFLYNWMLLGLKQMASGS